MMRLITRMIGRHKLLLLQFYPHLLRYLQSHEKDKIGEIFAMIIEACHELVPPEEIRPIIEKIISNFVTEQCGNLQITVGLNAIREILLRMPLALDESQIEYLVGFRNFRNASVVSACRSLINYFRDVCPNLLPKKFRGRFTKADEDGGNTKEEHMVYGRQQVSYDVDGVGLLAKAEGHEGGLSLAATRVLTDDDLRRIRLLKLKEAVKGVVKDEEPMAEQEEGDSEEWSDDNESEDDEENEDDLEEEGEVDMSEGEEVEDESAELGSDEEEEEEESN